MQKAPHALLPNVLFLFSIQGFPYFDSNSHFSLIFIILLKTCQTKFSFWLKASSQGTANLHKRGENLSIDRSIDMEVYVVFIVRQLISNITSERLFFYT